VSAPIPNLAAPRRRLALPVAVVALVLTVLVMALGSGSPEPTRAAGTSTTIAVIGDFGSNSVNELHVSQLVAGWAPDAVVTTGDDYYNVAGGSGTGKYDISIGKYYCAFLNGAATGTNCPTGGTADRNRFWPSTGNHDYSDAAGTTALGNYTAYFPDPINRRY